VPWSLSAVLNAFAGVFNVLAKAVSCVTPHADNRQEGGDEYQNNDAFNKCAHIVFAYMPIDVAGGGPLFCYGRKLLPLSHLRFGAPRIRGHWPEDIVQTARL
jgi:hypothetical protein